MGCPKLTYLYFVLRTRYHLAAKPRRVYNILKEGEDNMMLFDDTPPYLVLDWHLWRNIILYFAISNLFYNFVAEYKYIFQYAKLYYWQGKRKKNIGRDV